MTVQFTAHVSGTKAEQNATKRTSDDRINAILSAAYAYIAAKPKARRVITLCHWRGASSDIRFARVQIADGKATLL